MGIPELLPLIKDHDDVTPIVQLAEDHYKTHGRPLRIAVDEADWRFNNLTMGQVYAIREKSNEPAYQGIEKAFFYRICRFLTRNIQLVFVFDGPGRPAKRGRNGGVKINWRERDLLKELLRCFGIPYHEAPGEVEAECARLQILGLVDAVWSQDSDCLMFGCTLWIRDHRVNKEKENKSMAKENTKKSADSARVISAPDMKQKYGLDREGLVLFAMLVGGDYLPEGLRNCGAATALRAARAGLGQSLCHCRNQRDCEQWRDDLVAFLRATPSGRNIDVSWTYPDFKILQKYNNPKVTPDEILCNNTRLNRTYERPIDELNLLEVTSSRFNIWGKLYMNWVGPVLLTRYLVARDQALPKETVHSIKLTKRRIKDTPSISLVELKLTFSPFGLTTLRRMDFEGDRLGYWARAQDIPFDPDHRVECEIPVYLLQRALPPEVLNPPAPEAPKTGQKRKQSSENENAKPIILEPNKKARTPQPKPTNNSAPHTSKANSYTPSTIPRSNTSSRPIPKISSSLVIDLLSDSDTADDELFLPSTTPIRNRPSMPSAQIPNHILAQTRKHQDIPDIAPCTLEDEIAQIRAARLRHFGPNPPVSTTPVKKTGSSYQNKKPTPNKPPSDHINEIDCIDLKDL